MSILSRFFSLSAAKQPTTTAARAERMRSIMAQVDRQTEAMTRADISDLRQAWQRAISRDNPSRVRLMQLYRDSMVDGHLSGCITQRTEMVMARSFALVGADGMQNDAATSVLDAEWFKHLMRLTLESIYFGHTLIELGEVRTSVDGQHLLSGVTLVPREHVDPLHHRVLRSVGDDWRKGIDYTERPWSDTIIEVGTPSDLGLLLTTSFQTIPKRNMAASWDTFGEIFGMPMRIARTSTRDQRDIDRLNDMLVSSAEKLTVVTDMDTEIEFVESSKGDAYNVYDRRIDRCNSEISKTIIGQTMTIEDGSSLSQSVTHLKVLQNLVEADADRVRDMVNRLLLPRLVALGFAELSGLHFEWDYTIDYTPEQQLAIEQTLLQYYDIPPEYFSEKYGIELKPKTDLLTNSFFD